MKKKELNDLKVKTVKDLTKQVMEKKVEAKKIKMETMAGKQKNLKLYRNLRKDIAQIMTLLKEKEIIEKLEIKGQKSKVEETKKEEKKQ